MNASQPSPTVQVAQAAMIAAEQAVTRATSDLVAAAWQVVAAEVRELVPAATEIRTSGNWTEQMDVRLHLEAVLVDGEEVALNDAAFTQLQEALDEPLMWIADYESNPELLIAGDDVDDTNDHALPTILAVPEELPSQARFYYPAVVVVGLAGERISYAEISGVLDGLPVEWIDDTTDSEDPVVCPPALGRLAAEAIDRALPVSERAALHGGITVYAEEVHPLAKAIIVYRHQ